MQQAINDEMAIFEPDPKELDKLKIIASKLREPLMKALAEDYLILNLFGPPASDEKEIVYVLRLYAKAIRALAKVLDVIANKIENSVTTGKD